MNDLKDIESLESPKKEIARSILNTIYRAFDSGKVKDEPTNVDDQIIVVKAKRKYRVTKNQALIIVVIVFLVYSMSYLVLIKDESIRQVLSTLFSGFVGIASLVMAIRNNSKTLEDEKIKG